MAAVLGFVEIAGLIAATIAGLCQAPEYHLHGMLPSDLMGWRGAPAGAFIAFFAFLGFETLANLAEEVKDPHRTLPRGIAITVAASVVLYVTVSAAAVLADRPAANPLLGLFTGRSAIAFSAVAALAVANGVLVQIVTLARLFYGTARQTRFMPVLAQVHRRTRTPIIATLAAGGIVLLAALFVPFESLLVLTNIATLAVFALVSIALWRVQRVPTEHPVGFVVPGWIPPCAAALRFGLIAGELLG